MGVWAELRLARLEADAQTALVVPPGAQAGYPGDGYQPPAWLHYSRGVLFDGYSPPIYPHMKDFSAKRLIQAVAALGADSLRFQPIGYWAYYPSKAFRVHPELENRDLIDEVVQEAQKLGIHCYCYTGYGHPHMEVGWVDTHPEYAAWVLRNPEGKPYGTYIHYGDKVQRLCTGSDAYRRGIREVVRELCAHDIEGVYFDAPSAFGYTGICFCESCRRNYRQFTGMDLERLANLSRMNGLPFSWGEIPEQVDMEALIGWYGWMNKLTEEDLLDFRKIIHGSGKFMLCHNGQAWIGTTLPLQYRVPEGFMMEASTETYERLLTGLMGASMGRPYGKVSQMYLGSYALADFDRPAHEDPWVVHNTSLEDSDEIRMAGFTELASGGLPFYATGNRLYYESGKEKLGIGSGSTEPAREVFALMRRVESIHKDSVPLSSITIVPTWESLQLWRERSRSWNWPMMSGGFSLAMLDEGISFDVNPSTEMSEEWLQGQKVIVLCGASGLSEQRAERLTAWVKRGGGLLATYDSGLYDEQGRQRQDGGALREVLGIEMKGAALPSLPESYYRVTESHPALGRYGVGAIVQGDGRLVPVEPRGGARVIAECWNLGTGLVRGPAVVTNQYGQGRTIYVSGSLEANYLYDRVESNRVLLRSMVEYLGGGAPPPFRLKAPRGIYGILRQARSGEPVLWLLADVGFKDAAAGLMRQQYVPVTNVEVAIRVPQGRQVRGIRLMRAERSIDWQLEHGYAIVTLPTLHIAEVLHLQLM
ncbi:MAG TPA: beta-galactosidase trimerization domain-containing protein [Acidobacteriaceae bacterium]|jgi:hypothetical protein|nr:beta-galactosidase trimerization domain-containing protein [Acidobacteriaceae bacterium]